MSIKNTFLGEKAAIFALIILIFHYFPAFAATGTAPENSKKIYYLGVGTLFLSPGFDPDYKLLQEQQYTFNTYDDYYSSSHGTIVVPGLGPGVGITWFGGFEQRYWGMEGGFGFINCLGLDELRLFKTIRFNSYIDAKIFFLREGELRHFLVFGLAFVFLNVEDGVTYSKPNRASEDASLTGLNTHFGYGISRQISSWFDLTFSAVFSYTQFVSSLGLEQAPNAMLDFSFKELTLQFNLALVHYFR